MTVCTLLGFVKSTTNVSDVGGGVGVGVGCVVGDGVPLGVAGAVGCPVGLDFAWGVEFGVLRPVELTVDRLFGFPVDVECCDGLPDVVVEAVVPLPANEDCDVLLEL